MHVYFMELVQKFHYSRYMQKPLLLHLYCESMLLILSMILYRGCKEIKLLQFHNDLYGKASSTLQEVNYGTMFRNALEM
jgi:hypothetical protein